MRDCDSTLITDVPFLYGETVLLHFPGLSLISDLPTAPRASDSPAPYSSLNAALEKV